MNISEHFTLEELTASDFAIRHNLTNKPGPAELANLCRLAQLLEQVRTAIGKPIAVSSGYRSPQVNAAVGGTDRSQHMEGCAADIKVPGMTPYEVCQAIKKAGIVYDQLISEYGSWTHISVPSPNKPARRQDLTYRTGKPPASGILQ